MNPHYDPGDAFRIVLLRRILNGMAASPEEDQRVRVIARALVDKMRREQLAGDKFLARWDRFLELPLAELRETLLGDHEHAAEYRHAHPFAGVIDARELISLRAQMESLLGR